MARVPTKRLPVRLERGPDGAVICRPRYAVWETTLRCDQRCRFCGTRAGAPGENELNTEEALDVISQLAELGVGEVAMHGGEAYLRKDWVTLIRAVRDAGMSPTLVTGGRNITASNAQQVADAGLAGVAVSIDGTQETHDALRGVDGSFESARQAVTHLQNAGVAVGVNSQINRRNYRELPQLAEMICSMGLYGWQVQLMVPMGRASEAQDLWLEPYDLLEVIPLIAHARPQCDAAGVKLWPGNNVGYFGPFERVLRHERSRFGHSAGCGGGVISIGIEANGDVKACSAMASNGFVGGNVRNTRLSEIWAHAPELRFSRDFVLDDLWGECRSCYYARYCKGGCIWTAATVLGRRGNNPYCHHRALELLRRGKRERLRQVEEAPGHVRDQGRFELIVEDAPRDWIASLPALPEATAAAR